MTKPEKKIRIVLNSSRVATGLVSYEVPLAGPFGKMYKTRKEMTHYERVLDAEQEAMLEGARELSCLSGIELEVIDLGRKNIISKIAWHLMRRFENPPSLVFRGNIALELLLSKRRRRNEPLVF